MSWRVDERKVKAVKRAFLVMGASSSRGAVERILPMRDHPSVTEVRGTTRHPSSCAGKEEESRVEYVHTSLYG